MLSLYPSLSHFLVGGGGGLGCVLYLFPCMPRLLVGAAMALVVCFLSISQSSVIAAWPIFSFKLYFYALILRCNFTLELYSVTDMKPEQQKSSKLISLRRVILFVITFRG